MQAQAVIDFWTLCGEAGLTICIDGGWAVDALLEHQTRPHGDLDIALPASQVPRLRDILDRRGYADLPQPDTWQHNFVLQSASGDKIDVHSYELNPDGSNRLGVPYVAAHLTGSGRILGTRVRCVPPDVLVAFHTGYDVDEDDWHDVRRLCDRFGLTVPDAYARFVALESDASRPRQPERRRSPGSDRRGPQIPGGPGKSSS